MKVVTYQSPSGATIDLSLNQIATLEEVGTWLTDEHGAEYCTVTHGSHNGSPSLSDAEVSHQAVMRIAQLGGVHAARRIIMLREWAFDPCL